MGSLFVPDRVERMECLFPIDRIERLLLFSRKQYLSFSIEGVERLRSASLARRKSLFFIKRSKRLLFSREEGVSLPIWQSGSMTIWQSGDPYNGY